MTTARTGVKRDSPVRTGIERESSIPLFLQIEEELKGEITEGRLGQFARLPSENELTEHFGVSRMTVRKALDRMVADGLLFRRAGKGTYVAPSKIEHVASQATSFSDSMREHGHASTTHVLAAGITKPAGHIAALLGESPNGAVVYLRRLRLVEGEPMAIHQSYLPIRWAHVLDTDLSGSLTQALENLGAHVSNVDDSVEAVPAVDDDATLLGVPPASPLLKISGVATAANGTVIRYSEALYRGDRFSLKVNSPRISQPTIAPLL